MTIGIGQLSAQKVVTVKAGNYDISDNLDLEAVAYLFGDSENLEEFEMKLNDPELRVSNLDLNYDGYVDYLRVVEVKEGRVFVVTVQAVLGNDLYQDVATIDVMLKNRRNVYVQIIGNEYIYGHNYIIEPVFVHRPVIYTYFMYSHRPVWVSPWHWSQYPRYYSYRKPHSVHVYHHHVYDYYRPKVKCHYVYKRRVHKAYHLHKKYHRNDFAKSKPNYSFDERNSGVENYRELSKRRSSHPNVNRAAAGVKVESNSTRKVPGDWRSENTRKRSYRQSTRPRVREEALAGESKRPSVRKKYSPDNNASRVATKPDSKENRARTYQAKPERHDKRNLVKSEQARQQFQGPSKNIVVKKESTSRRKSRNSNESGSKQKNTRRIR
jgi:hypothetical protein